MPRSHTFLPAFLIGLVALITLPSAAHGQAADQSSFSNLIAALNNINAEIRALENQDLEDVEFANVREMRNTLDESQNQKLDEVIGEADTEALHDFLDDNAPLQTAFREKSRDKVNVEDVVAVDMLSDGTVVVYYEPTL